MGTVVQTAYLGVSGEQLRMNLTVIVGLMIRRFISVLEFQQHTREPTTATTKWQWSRKGLTGSPKY